MAAAWSELHMDLLGLILERLPLADYMRFGSVCVSWNLAVKGREFRPKAQIPWLMIPNDHDEKSARFFSISEKRTYDIRLPDPPIRSRLWIGSSHGWLITVDSQCEMHLLNPITATQIQLPSIATLPFVHAIRDPIKGHIDQYILLEDLASVVYGEGKENDLEREFSPENMRIYFFHKAVLSSAPSKDGGGDYVIMLLHEPGSRLVFMRNGDKVWTSLRTPYGFKDIILRNGMFHTISCWGTIFAWDFIDGFTNTRRHVNPLESKGYSFMPTLVSKGGINACILSYIINTPDGRLLILHREQTILTPPEEEGPYYTDDFEIYLMHSETHKWSPVGDIEDTVVFIGNNHSMSVSAAEFPELRRNSIYFTDDNLEFSSLYKHDSRDIGAFDLTERCIKPLDSLPSHSTWPSSVWFTPVLF